MTKRSHRQQSSEKVDLSDIKPLVVNPLTRLDRLHNPDDIEPDAVAIANGPEHHASLETRAEELQVRGSGGRKRSGPYGRHRPGRDLSKRR